MAQNNDPLFLAQSPDAVSWQDILNMSKGMYVASGNDSDPFGDMARTVVLPEMPAQGSPVNIGYGEKLGAFFGSFGGGFAGTGISAAQGAALLAGDDESLNALRRQRAATNEWGAVPGLRDSGWTGWGQAAGSGTAFLALSAGAGAAGMATGGPGAAGVAAAVAAGVVGASGTMYDMYEQHLAAGGNPKDAWIAALAGAGIGATEGLPLGIGKLGRRLVGIDELADALVKLETAVGRDALKRLTPKEIITLALIEGGEEAVQEGGSNLAQQAVQVYGTKTREGIDWGEAGQNAMYGAGVGGVFSAAGSALYENPKRDELRAQFDKIVAQREAAASGEERIKLDDELAAKRVELFTNNFKSVSDSIAAGEAQLEEIKKQREQANNEAEQMEKVPGYAPERVAEAKDKVTQLQAQEDKLVADLDKARSVYKVLESQAKAIEAEPQLDEKSRLAGTYGRARAQAELSGTLPEFEAAVQSGQTRELSDAELGDFVKFVKDVRKDPQAGARYGALDTARAVVPRTADQQRAESRLNSLGYEVTFVDFGAETDKGYAVEGAYAPSSKRIFLNANLSEADLIRRVARHEAAHAIFENDPKQWIEFADKVRSLSPALWNAAQEAWVDARTAGMAPADKEKFRKKYQKTIIDETGSKTLDWFSATIDALEANPALVTELQQADPGFFSRMLDWIKRTLNKVGFKYETLSDKDQAAVAKLPALADPRLQKMMTANERLAVAQTMMRLFAAAEGAAKTQVSSRERTAKLFAQKTIGEIVHARAKKSLEEEIARTEMERAKETEASKAAAAETKRKEAVTAQKERIRTAKPGSPLWSAIEGVANASSIAAANEAAKPLIPVSATEIETQEIIDAANQAAEAQVAKEIEKETAARARETEAARKLRERQEARDAAAKAKDEQRRAQQEKEKAAKEASDKKKKEQDEAAYKDKLTQLTANKPPAAAKRLLDAVYNNPSNEDLALAQAREFLGPQATDSRVLDVALNALQQAEARRAAERVQAEQRQRAAQEAERVAAEKLAAKAAEDARKQEEKARAAAQKIAEQLRQQEQAAEEARIKAEQDEAAREERKAEKIGIQYRYGEKWTSGQLYVGDIIDVRGMGPAKIVSATGSGFSQRIIVVPMTRTEAAKVAMAVSQGVKNWWTRVKWSGDPVTMDMTDDRINSVVRRRSVPEIREEDTQKILRERLTQISELEQGDEPRFSLDYSANPVSVGAVLDAASKRIGAADSAALFRVALNESNLDSLPNVERAQLGDLYVFNTQYGKQYAAELGNGLVLTVPKWGQELQSTLYSTLQAKFGEPVEIKRPKENAYDYRKARFSLGDGPRVGSTFSGFKTVEARLGYVTSALMVENDPAIVDAYNEANNATVKPQDVLTLTVSDVVKADVHLLHNSPVCKQFSLANKNRKPSELEANSAKKIADIIRGAKPPAVTVENVPSYQDFPPFQDILNALDEVGYKYEVLTVNAADYGAPMQRTRMLLRAVREGELPAQPKTQEPGDWYAAIEDLLLTAEIDPIGLGENERSRIDKFIADGKLDAGKPIIAMGGSGFRNQPSAANSGGPAPTLMANAARVRILMPDGTIYRASPRMLARLMGMPDGMTLPKQPGKATRSASDYYLTKKVLGNGVHGVITEKFIKPLLPAEAIAADADLRPRFSLVSKEDDAAYMDAVNRGDMDSADRMVRKAAQESGYTIEAHHGTARKFNEFKLDIGAKVDSGVYGKGFYFGSKRLAEIYAKTSANRYSFYEGRLTLQKGEEVKPRVMRVYLKLKNPYKVFAQDFWAKINVDVAKMATGQDAKTLLDAGPIREKESEAITRVLKQNGYDGVDSGHDGQSGEFVVFDPSQIKSADPVTYDDQGNVVPLSQRFAEDTNDIRFSLTDGQWFSPSIRALENSPQKIGTAEQWLAVLAKHKGTKAEIEYADLKGWFAGRTSIPKDHIIAYLKTAIPVVAETVHGPQFGQNINVNPRGKTLDSQEIINEDFWDKLEREWGLIAEGVVEDRSVDKYFVTFTSASGDVVGRLQYDSEKEANRTRNAINKDSAQAYFESHPSEIKVLEYDGWDVKEVLALAEERNLEADVETESESEYYIVYGDGYRDEEGPFLSYGEASRQASLGTLNAVEAVDQYGSDGVAEILGYTSLGNLASALGFTYESLVGPAVEYGEKGYRLLGGNNYREVVLHSKLELTNPKSNERVVYQGQHFSKIRNVFAWMRTTDRAYASENDTLLLEEIQSDWGQQAIKDLSKGDNQSSYDAALVAYKESVKNTSRVVNPIFETSSFLNRIKDQVELWSPSGVSNTQRSQTKQFVVENAQALKSAFLQTHDDRALKTAAIGLYLQHAEPGDWRAFAAQSPTFASSEFVEELETATSALTGGAIPKNWSWPDFNRSLQGRLRFVYGYDSDVYELANPFFGRQLPMLSKEDARSILIALSNESIAKRNYDNEFERFIKVRQAQQFPWSKNFHELVLRRALKLAVDNGYSYLAIPESSSLVGLWGTQEVSWRTNPNGGFDVVYTPQLSGNEAVQQAVAAGRERGLIWNPQGTVNSQADLLALMQQQDRWEAAGKMEEMAAKAWMRMQESAQGSYQPRAEGFQANYDKKYVNTANELFKKYGMHGEPMPPVGTLPNATVWKISDKARSDVGPMPLFSLSEDGAKPEPAQPKRGPGGRFVSSKEVARSEMELLRDRARRNKVKLQQLTDESAADIAALTGKAAKEGEGTLVGEEPSVALTSATEPGRAFQRGVRQYYRDNPMAMFADIEKDKQARQSAKEQLSLDYNGTYANLQREIQETGTLSEPWKFAAMAQIAADKADAVAAKYSEAAFLEATQANREYQQARSIASANLRIIRDPVVSARRRAMAHLTSGTPFLKRKIKKLNAALAKLGDQRDAAEIKKIRSEIERIEAAHARAVTRAINKLKARGMDPEAMFSLAEAKDWANYYRLFRRLESEKLVAEVSEGANSLSDVVGSMLIEARQSMMLSGIATHVANTAGNLVNTHLRTTTLLTEAILSKVMPGLADPVRMGEAKAYLHGYVRSLKKAGQNFLMSYATEAPVFEADLNNESLSEINNRAKAIPGLAGRILRFPSLTTLQAFDEFFKTTAGYAEAAELAYRDGQEMGLSGVELERHIDTQLNDYNSDVWSSALVSARERVFQGESGPIVQTMLKTRGFIDDLTPALPFGSLLFPYVKTPAAIFKAGLALPIAPPLAVYRMFTQGRDYWGSRSMVTDSASAVLGMALFLAIDGMLDDDDDNPVITGASPQKYSDYLQSRRTAPPTSIRVGDNWHDYGRIEPASVSLATTVDAVRSFRKAMSEDPESATKAFQTAWESVAGQLKDKTFLRALGDIIKMTNDWEQVNFPRFARDLLVTPMLPALVRGIEGAKDPYERENIVYKQEGKSATTAALDSISWIAYPDKDAPDTPPIKYDLWGRPVEKAGRSYAARLTRLFPVSQEAGDISQLDILISRYNDKVDKGLVPNVRDKPEFRPPTREVRGTQFILNPDEYARLCKEAGEMAASRLANRVLNYEDPTEKDIQKIKDVISSSRKRVLDQILRDRK